MKKPSRIRFGAVFLLFSIHRTERTSNPARIKDFGLKRIERNKIKILLRSEWVCAIIIVFIQMRRYFDVFGRRCRLITLPAQSRPLDRTDNR